MMSLNRPPKTLCLVIVVWLLWGCGSYNQGDRSMRASVDTFDVQGHRGARGHRPENTLAAFEYALKLGVSTLELDIVISADSQVVVSHDPFFNAAICSHPDGRPVTRDEESGLLIYSMSRERIRSFDCGRRGNPRFPEQVPMPAYKPLLSEVFDLGERLSGSTIRYNIETKVTPDGDGINHPDPETVTRLLYREIVSASTLDRVTVQSFDPRTLRAVRSLDPGVQTALLIATSTDMGVEKNLDLLGFSPTIYSPDYSLVDADLVGAVHSRDIKLLPWTVNTPEKIRTMVELGVDGIISDYPDRVLKILGESSGG
jgi:glycerophosphoryl diester phosphodiesterase